MTIDINNINPNRPDRLKPQDSGKGVSDAQAKAESKQDAPNSKNTSDNVSLSDTAKSLTQIENGLKSLSDVDQARVDAVREKLESGNYEVNAKNMAQKMLEMDK